MEIDEPAVLTKLPRAGLSEEGSRWFSQVQGVRDGRSRKRHEICAAIDGNALNILEVVNGRTIVSWPIPPDSSFASQPYSERISIGAKNFIRKCWCAAQRRGTLTLQYFEQTKNGTSTTSSTQSHALTESQAPVVKIEPVGTTERVIVVAQEDGNITMMPSNGSGMLQKYCLAPGFAPMKILTTQHMSLQEASVSVLKSRPDLFTTLSADHIIMTAVYEVIPAVPTTVREIRLGLWALSTLQHASKALLLDPMLTYDLSAYSNLSPSSKIIASFKVAGTRLELTVNSSISTFDLTSSIPRRLNECPPLSSDQITAIELSHDIRLVLAPGKLDLYNSKFKSLLASRQLSGDTLKRKRDSSSFPRMSFIAYFSQLRRILAYSGSQLLAINIHFQGSERQSFKQSSLLIGNILRGQNEQSDGLQPRGNQIRGQDWTERSKELDRFAELGDAVGFEQKVKEICDLKTWEDLKKLDVKYVDFILSKTFVLTDTDDASERRLELSLYAPEIFEWCARCGFLDEYRIFKALQVRLMALEQNILYKCLLEAETYSRALEDYVRYAPFMHPTALISIVKLLINRALAASDDGQEMLVTRATGVALPDQVGRQETGVNTSNLFQQSTLSAQCLVHALQRLGFTGSSTISSQLRNSFDQTEVLALIQFLRQQLFLGGYTRLAQTRKYPSPPASPRNGEGDMISDGGPQVALENIIILLNGCIDSLGAIGILGTSEDQAFVEKMVPELRSEIENATRGVEDSTYLQGLLRETLRYAESVERQPFEVRRKVEKPNAVRGEEGKIVTVYTETDAGDITAQLPTTLPLSLKAEEDVSLVKTRKGGQHHSRSVREMGMLKDRLKAPYSFERLVL